MVGTVANLLKKNVGNFLHSLYQYTFQINA